MNVRRIQYAPIRKWKRSERVALEQPDRRRLEMWAGNLYLGVAFVEDGGTVRIEEQRDDAKPAAVKRHRSVEKAFAAMLAATK